MAPALTEHIRSAPHLLSKNANPNANAPRDVFPDGIRTSGQHPPLYGLLKSYEEFPKEIKGSTVWKKEDYENNPERWTHTFTEVEIEEIGKAADDFISSGTPLTGISKVCYALLRTWIICGNPLVQLQASHHTYKPFDHFLD